MEEKRKIAPTLAGSLLGFCRKIGVSAKDIDEAIDEVRLETEVTVAAWSAVKPEDLKRLASVLGTGLTELSLGSAGFPLLEIHEGRIPEDVEAKVIDIARKNQPGLPLNLVIHIDKEKLALPLKPSFLEAYGRILIYFFGKSMHQQLLKASLTELDELVFDGGCRPSLIMVSDAEQGWSSPLLRIVGEKQLKEQPELGKIAVSRESRNSIDRFRKIRDSLSWGGFQLTNITPLHFLRDDGISPWDGEIDNVLARQLLHASILYTANRSYAEDDGTYLAFFNAAEQTSSVQLAAATTPKLDRDVLASYAGWLVTGRHADRLLIFQSVAARQLLGLENSKENFALFCERLRQILADADWNYRAFADEKVNRHFEVHEEVSGYAAKIADDVSRAIDTITKGLVDTTLGTIGLVVLTLIAALIEDKTHGQLFRYLMLAYVAYLLIFQLCYRMSAIYDGYRVTTDGAEKRIGGYQPILGEANISRIKASLKLRKKRFEIWFSISLAVYLAVAVGLGLLAYFLPAYLAEIKVPAATGG